jgi:hypothetical protein
MVLHSVPPASHADGVIAPKVGGAGRPSDTNIRVAGKQVVGGLLSPADGLRPFRRTCTLATPEPIKDWSLTSLRERLIKIGAKIISHDRYVAFQMAEVAIPRQLFAAILRLIAELRPPPDPSSA